MSVLAIRKKQYKAIEKELYPGLQAMLSHTEQIAIENQKQLLQSIDLEGLKWLPASADVKKEMKRAVEEVSKIAVVGSHCENQELVHQLEKAYTVLCEAEIIADYLREKSNRYLRVLKTPSRQDMEAIANEFATVNLSKCNL
jgi:ribosomal protein L17